MVIKMILGNKYLKKEMNFLIFFYIFCIVFLSLNYSKKKNKKGFEILKKWKIMIKKQETYLN